MARHPAYQSGHDAFYRGELTNPHNVTSIAFKEWQAGQDHAYFENLKQVKEDELNGR
jgi:hypothetical protein